LKKSLRKSLPRKHNPLNKHNARSSSKRQIKEYNRVMYSSSQRDKKLKYLKTKRQITMIKLPLRKTIKKSRRRGLKGKKK
jgi:hypothetical protein